MTALWVIIACGLLSIVYGVWATMSVLKADAGSAKMQEIAGAVREGAQAYLKRQYTTIGMVGVVIFALVGYFLGWLVATGFAIGAVLSGVAGFIVMNVSVRANVRTAPAISAIRRRSRTTSVTTSVIAPAWLPTCSKLTRSPLLRPWCWRPSSLPARPSLPA
jgi:Na+/H+-translocating membrane pyrophosphatase